MISRKPLPVRPLGVSSRDRSGPKTNTASPSPDNPTTALLTRTDSPATSWASPPRRPTSSSWGEGSSKSGSLKLEHVMAVVDVEDVDTDSPVPMLGVEEQKVQQRKHRQEEEKEEEEEEGEEDTSRELSRAMGAEKFYDIFHERIGSGAASVPQLVEICEAAGLPVSEEQVVAALAKVCPEANTTDAGLPFPQCQQVFLLLQVERRRSETQQEALGKAGSFTQWVAALSDNEATNLLLFVVLALCCLSAFLAGGLAILLLFLDSISSLNDRMTEDLGIIQDTVEVFAKQLAPQETTSGIELFLTTLSSILQYVVYVAGTQRKKTMLLEVITSVSNTFTSWLASGQQQTYINFAVMTAMLANSTLTKYGRNATSLLFDELNSGLASGYEVLLATRHGNAAVEYLTTFRFSDECANRSCTTNSPSTTLLEAALSGSTSAAYTVDYRLASVYAGFSSLSGLGVEVSVDYMTQLLARFAQMRGYLESWSSTSNNSYEFAVAYTPSAGVGTLLTNLSGCDSACGDQMVSAGTPLYRAITGETGVMEFTNFRGVRCLAAFTPVADYPLGLSVQVPLSGIVKESISSIASLLNTLNSKYPSGSEEFELATFSTQGNITNFTHVTAYRYGDQCPSGQCVTPEYVRQAAKNCSTGVMNTTDYRNVSVLVGYNCFSDLNVVLSYKYDVADVNTAILEMIVEAVNDRSAKDNGTSAQFLVATPKDGLTAAEVKGYGDFVVASKLKYPNACAKPNCSWNRESALRALQDRKDVVDCTDYRDVAVKAAPSRSTAIDSGIGIALELDHTEALQATVDTAIRVGCFAIGMVVGCTLVLMTITKLFLRSMIRAREEGNKAVETEKDRFSRLVGSMYPAYVLPRLLAGEKQMVCEVPGAAVFFSDIHEFTSASNTLSSRELLQVVGYTYGVMDKIADRFGVYKVKTIGDAYLAVLGLPGSESANPSLDLLRFASYVCQVFGNRFVHPVEGQVLAVMNNSMAWTGRQGRRKRKTNASCSSLPQSLPREKSGDAAEAENSSPGRQWPQRMDSVVSSNITDSTEGSQRGGKVQCIMSYGLAVGKLVAGVLAGRCPMFDIWGVTVNLASRMQSTGEPGRIQVSEHLYHRVIADEGQPFSFEAPRKVFCKGFGNVNAYMVRTTIEGLPKDIQSELGLEPRYGAFHFDNLLSKLSGPEASASEAPKPTPPSESQKPTPTSPNLSAHPERTVSIVLTPSNGKQRAPIVNEQRRVSGRTGNSPKAVN